MVFGAVFLSFDFRVYEWKKNSLCSPHSVATQDLDLVLPADREGNPHLVRATSMLVALKRVLSELFFSQESSEYA